MGVYPSGSLRQRQRKKIGEKERKRAILYSSHDATFCRGKLAGGLETANRENEKSCGERQRQKKKEGKRIRISSCNRLSERNRPLITLDNRFAKHCETNATSVDD